MPALQIPDPDVTERTSASYWAAALLLAMESRNRERSAVARRHLAELGIRLRVERIARRRKVVCRGK